MCYTRELGASKAPFKACATVRDHTMTTAYRYNGCWYQFQITCCRGALSAAPVLPQGVPSAGTAFELAVWAGESGPLLHAARNPLDRVVGTEPQCCPTQVRL
jgi:hypothetical protein